MNVPLYKLSDKALFTSLGEDIVALNVEDGQCYGMEKVTAEVWRLLAEPIAIERICNRLTEIYEVEPALCRSDVERLIAQFQREGLVETVNSAP